MTTIKTITAEEIPVLLEMVRELARFEKLEHILQDTPELFREAFFGQPPAAGAFLARVDDEPVAYAIYFYTFSSFLARRGVWLEDVYVKPSYRRRGIGGQLMKAVARIGIEQNCGRFEWTALNWNTSAHDVYKKMGAQPLEEWVLFRMDAEGMRKLGAPPPYD